jgi:diguanylate cyclase (GGDEF)-like protein
MNEWGVGSLIVEDYGSVSGIITSRDVRSTHPNRIVADAMTPNPINVPPSWFIWDALKIMDKHNIERVLIMEENHLLGLLTREAVRMKLSEYLDPLSGLYRAPYIQSLGESFLANNHPFQLLFIDLNGFGEINKRYGHPFGDDVIKEYSDLAVSLVVEDRDYVCRYAGDEFVIITTADEETVDRIVERVANPVDINGVSVSAAVGRLNSKREPEFFSLTFRELLSRASLLSTSGKQQLNV